MCTIIMFFALDSALPKKDLTKEITLFLISLRIYFVVQKSQNKMFLGSVHKYRMIFLKE